MPMTKVEKEHDQLVVMLNQLLEEREILLRENEYLKAKLNNSILMENIQELKHERDLLFKLLSNLTISKENHSNQFSSPSTSNGKSIDSKKQTPTLLRTNPSLTINPTRFHRLTTNIEQSSTSNYRSKISNGLSSSSSTILLKHPQTNKKILIYKTPTTSQAQESTKPITKPDLQLKHSQNSPFQHYRSQSLQNLS